MNGCEPFFENFRYLTVLDMFRNKNIFLECHLVCQMKGNEAFLGEFLMPDWAVYAPKKEHFLVCHAVCQICVINSGRKG
jgi:hypothetical protein